MSICWYGTINTMHSAMSRYRAVAMPSEPTMPRGRCLAGSLASSAALATARGNEGRQGASCAAMHPPTFA